MYTNFFLSLYADLKKTPKALKNKTPKALKNKTQGSAFFAEPWVKRINN
jgi:hypothetical protein